MKNVQRSRPNSQRLEWVQVENPELQVAHAFPIERIDWMARIVWASQ